MKRMILAAILMLGISVLLGNCTQNQKAKDYGGTAKLELPVNQKLIVVTWKDSDLWYLTREMVKGDTAITYTFQEKSSWGVWNGTYIISEKKSP